MTTDTNPLRPWEKYQVDAFEWDDAKALQQAFRDGAAEYHEEQKKQQEWSEKENQSLEKLRAQAGG